MLDKSLKELLDHYRDDPKMGEAVHRYERGAYLAQRELMKALADLQNDFYREIEDRIKEHRHTAS